MPFWNDQLEARQRPLQRHVSADNIQTVTEATFDHLVSQAPGPVAVEFMSYGCVHCRAMEPVLQEVAAEIAATETVFRVNIAVEQELATRYQVEGTPTLVMLLKGREVGRSEGPRPTIASVMATVTKPFETLDEL